METNRTMKRSNWNRVVLLTLVGLGFVLSIGPVNLSQAALVTYPFSGTVTGVSPSQQGFPSSLQGVQAGDTLTGSYTYDSATPSSPNPFASLDSHGGRSI
jgi:hypothetical protein